MGKFRTLLCCSTLLLVFVTTPILSSRSLITNGDPVVFERMYKMRISRSVFTVTSLLNTRTTVDQFRLLREFLQGAVQKFSNPLLYEHMQHQGLRPHYWGALTLRRSLFNFAYHSLNFDEDEWGIRHNLANAPPVVPWCEPDGRARRRDVRFMVSCSVERPLLSVGNFALRNPHVPRILSALAAPNPVRSTFTTTNGTPLKRILLVRCMRNIRVLST